MTAWVLYTLLVSVFVALASRAAESIGRNIGYPVRWIWAGAGLLIIALAATAPTREHIDTPAQAIKQVQWRPVEVNSTAPTWSSAVEHFITNVRSGSAAKLTTLVWRVEHALPRWASTSAIALWFMASASLAGLLVFVQLRFTRARRRWPIGDVQGVAVRIAPNVGPVVIGLARPEIVVPRWLLDREAEQQRLVVQHEAQHVQARDTLLLAAGCVVVALMPWNPIAWYVLSRLRLAVELDCDARVLRGGAAPHSYGALLIDVAEKNAAARLGVPALADDSSHLHQRILAMTPKRPKFLLARAVTFGALGFAAALAACEAKMPTAADVNRLDAASTEKVAKEFKILQDTSKTLYLVDGRRVNEQEAKQIAASDIQSVEVDKSELGGQIRIRTKNGPPLPPGDESHGRFKISMDSAKRVAGSQHVKFTGDSVIIRDNVLANPSAAAPLFVIDGVKQSSGVLAEIKRDDIQSIEVLKGPAAAAQYGNDPSAANGVVIIKTKKGGSH